MAFDTVMPDTAISFTFDVGLTVSGTTSWSALSGNDVRFQWSWVLSLDDSFDVNTDAVWGPATMLPNQIIDLQVSSNTDYVLVSGRMPPSYLKYNNVSHDQFHNSPWLYCPGYLKRTPNRIKIKFQYVLYYHFEKKSKYTHTVTILLFHS